jgi:outer membrane protein insertion porin family
VILGILALSGPPPETAPPPLVESVAFDADGPVDEEEVRSLLEISAGDRLDDDAVRRSIQNLYATGRFADIRADRTDVGEGRVAVTFHLFCAYRVDPLGFTGAPVSGDELRKALPFHAGDTYDAAEVNGASQSLKKLLATAGYVEAEVTPSVQFNATTFRAAVTYRITSGRPSRVGPPVFEGDLEPLTREELAREMRLKPGKRYREDKAVKDAQRLQRFLVKKGYLQSEISLIGVDTEGAAALPVYRVVLGPLVTFSTSGVEEKKVLKDIRNLLKDQVFQEDLLSTYVASLRQKYQQKGYHEVKVDYSITQSPGHMQVSLVVETGPKEWIEKVLFEGNRVFSDSRLESLMLTRPRSLLRSGSLVDDVLAADRRAIVAYYRANGYEQVKVAEPRISSGAKPGALIATLLIEAGPQTFVSQVDLNGCEHVNQKEVESLLTVRTGVPYDPTRVEDSRLAILNFYHNRGWVKAAVDAKVDISEDFGRASVSFRATEGEREYFGKTVIRGNSRTRTDRIKVPIRWKEGDPFSEAKVLDTQRELARTGAFQKIEAATTPAEGGRPVQNVHINLTEARPISLLYGVGYQYEYETGEQSPFAILGVSYNNLFGRFQSLSLEGRYAPITQHGAVYLNFRDPYPFDLDLPLTATVFYSDQPILHISSRQGGAFLDVSRQVTTHTRLGIRWEYDRINVTSANPLDIVQLLPSEQNIAESTIGATLLYDLRDDPIDPHHGIFVNTFAKDAYPVAALSATANYAKFFAQVSGYVPFLGGVLAGSVRAGAMSVSTQCTASGNACIPIAERFFSGGRTSNRAFDTGAQGIPSETVNYDVIETVAGTPGKGNCNIPTIDPDRIYNCNFGPRLVGGSREAGWNAEWRFPIYGGFGGTIFYDASQVWADRSFHFHMEGQDGIRQSVGVGIRYLTAVGPIRLEYGRVLFPQTFLVPVLRQDLVTKEIVDTGQKTRQTEARYQLFLSIGYPF